MILLAAQRRRVVLCEHGSGIVRTEVGGTRARWGERWFVRIVLDGCHNTGREAWLPALDGYLQRLGGNYLSIVVVRTGSLQFVERRFERCSNPRENTRGHLQGQVS